MLNFIVHFHALHLLGNMSMCSSLIGKCYVLQDLLVTTSAGHQKFSRFFFSSYFSTFFMSSRPFHDDSPKILCVKRERAKAEPQQESVVLLQFQMYQSAREQLTCLYQRAFVFYEHTKKQQWWSEEAFVILTKVLLVLFFLC